MPIYEYKCESCEAVLEKIQKFSDPPLRECPECGRETLIKLVSAPSFRLKGSGWYETDFKTGNRKNGAGEDTAANSASSSADSGSANSKSAEPAKSSNKSSDNSSDKSSDKSSSESTTKPAGTAKTGTD